MRNLVLGFFALLVAVVSFGNAAAQIGAKLPMFKSWGPAFYNNRADLLQLEMAVAKRPALAKEKRLGTMSASMIARTPLNARAIRNYGMHREALGDRAGARRIFGVSNAISRRDGFTQYWLIDDAARRGDVAGALDHFDSILRTLPDATQPMIERLAVATTIPAARRAMVRFVRADNPWFARYVEAAVAKLPTMEPLAQLLVDARSAPDVAALRTPYRQIVDGLAKTSKIALIRRLYPLLPGAEASDLSVIKIDENAFKGGYAPVVWDLGESSERGGALVMSGGSPGLELYGLPDTRGIAARKLVIPSTAARNFSWTVTDRSGAEDGAAYWILDCVREQGVTTRARSINLLDPKVAPRGHMVLPRGCDAIMVSFEVDGGTGRDPARMVFGSIAVN